MPLPTMSKTTRGTNVSAAHSAMEATRETIKVELSSHMLRQQRDFMEATRQTKPIAAAGTRDALTAAAAVQRDTARPTGLRFETAHDQVTRSRSLNAFTAGANPQGRLAEIIVISDLRALHHGGNPDIVNPPAHVANNVRARRLCHA